MAVSFDIFSMHNAVVAQLVLALFANVDGNYGYNMVVFTILLFAFYARPEPNPVLTGLCLLCTSFLIDIIVLGVYAHQISTQTHDKSGLKQKFIDTSKFALAMTIIGLIVKPFTTYCCYLEYRLRGGDIVAAIKGEPTYANVDEQAEQGSYSQAPAYAQMPRGDDKAASAAASAPAQDGGYQDGGYQAPPTQVQGDAAPF
eukprot:TRINITY_DN12279_c1_g1_i10.p2 TRINITY_DN12279_c1_g1~~TRINITY_DN12279_c1_g1_i10.p2  ORF type:complete len:200 (+),score=35.34 TRINITY_DN12279_c1_g1_i10:1356-1955(+)